MTVNIHTYYNDNNDLDENPHWEMVEVEGEIDKKEVEVVLNLKDVVNWILVFIVETEKSTYLKLDTEIETLE